jgi:hypothetical protein
MPRLPHMFPSPLYPHHRAKKKTSHMLFEIHQVSSSPAHSQNLTIFQNRPTPRCMSVACSALFTFAKKVLRWSGVRHRALFTQATGEKFKFCALYFMLPSSRLGSRILRGGCSRANGKKGDLRDGYLTSERVHDLSHLYIRSTEGAGCV